MKPSSIRQSTRPSAHSPIKVGLVLSSMKVEAWIYQLVERVNRSTYASVEVIAINDYTGYPPSSQRHSMIEMDNEGYNQKEHTRGSLLNKLKTNIANRFKVYPDYLEIRNLSALLGKTPKESIVSECHNDSFILQKESIILLESYKIDVLLNLTHQMLRGDIAQSFPYGIWYYKFTDIFTNYNGTPGLRETLSDWPEVGSALLCVGESSKEDKIIMRSYSCPDSTWFQKTNNPNYWKSLSFMPRALEKCHRIGKDAFQHELRNNTPYPWFHAGEPSARLTRWELFKLLAVKAAQKVRLRINDRIFFEQWYLFFNLNPATSNQLACYQSILPPKDRFWADPFVIYQEDKYYIFIEELIFTENVGFLSVIEMDKSGNYSAPEVVLKKPYHLSWPNVFMYEGEYYMIPETAENRTIDLYRCTSFPNQWEHEMTLMKDVGAVDTTVFFKDEKWWLFTNIKENEGASYDDELFLFYSKSLLTDQWIAHPANPVVSDVKKARPAGKIFEKDGRLYRPSQNCSHYYGYGLNINEITQMDEYSYKENTVSRIEPNWDKDVIATHTYNTDHHMTIMDGIIKRKHRG